MVFSVFLRCTTDSNPTLEQLLGYNDEYAHYEHKFLPYFRRLREEEGFVPRVVYDIGARFLTWTSAAKQVWPESTYVPFEALDYVEPLFKHHGAPYFIGILNDKDGSEVLYYKNAASTRVLINGDGTVYNEDDPAVKMVSRTLDSVINEKGMPLPDFIKMDAEASEYEIIRGGMMAMNNAKHLLLEARVGTGSNFPGSEVPSYQSFAGEMLAKDILPLVERLGWYVQDYINVFGNNVKPHHIELMFARSNTRPEKRKEIYHLLNISDMLQ